MVSIDYFVYTYGPTLAITILCAIFGTLGHAAKRLYTSYINTKEKQSVARTVAAFVQQAWKDIHGTEKMGKALDTAAQLLKNKGIDYDAAEMRILIEAAVAEFNGAFRKPMADEATADATRRVYDDGDRDDSGLLE